MRNAPGALEVIVSPRVNGVAALAEGDCIPPVFPIGRGLSGVRLQDIQITQFSKAVKRYHIAIDSTHEPANPTSTLKCCPGAHKAGEVNIT